MPSHPEATLSSIRSHLLQSTHLTYPPPHATHRSLTSAISSLQLHPTLEAALHMLNADLPSAHFLVRHMQAPPAVEGMLLHSILHRCEGDFNNARAWVSDVRDACDGWVPKHRDEESLEEQILQKTKGGGGIEETLVDFVYGASDSEGPEILIDGVEMFRKAATGNREGYKEKEAEFETRAREELEKVLEWCKKKFGEEKWMDASSAWVKNSDEVSKMQQDMTSGDKGWRKF